MKYILLYNLFLFSSISLFAQKELLNNLDTLQPNYQYAQYTTETFFKSGIGDQLIDTDNIDVELLEAAILHNLNKYRAKRKRTPLQYSSKLHLVAYNYLKYYSENFASKYYRRTSRNEYRSLDFYYLKWIAERLEYGSKIFYFRSSYPSILKVQRNQGAYFYKKNSTVEHFFYGKKSRLQDKKKKAKIKPVKVLTYSEWAVSVITRHYRVMRSTSNTDFACHIELDYLGGGKIPKAKIIAITAKIRLAELKASGF